MLSSPRRLILPCLGFAFAASLFAAQPGTTAVDRFGLHEVAFAATGTYANPYTEGAAEATLTAPDGSTRRLPLFWDGGATWRLRISPDQVGHWRWRVASRDAGLNGREGSFACRASTRHGSIQPMAGSSHNFQYQNGERLWFMGDTAWSFVTDVPAENHNDASVARYLERRAAQGFNVIHTMLLSEAGDGNAGGLPFTALANETLNPAYWQAIDRRVALANSRGLVMGLAIAWGRKVVDGRGEPYAWGRFPSREARLRYARHIAARYSAYDVYFIISGEWHAEIRSRPDEGSLAVRDDFIAIGDALRAADAHGRMIAIHPMNHHGSTREFNRATWMSFGDYQQNYRHVHERILTSRHYAKPVVNSEYGYHLRDSDTDGLPDKENSLNEHDIRHASWDIAMAGGYFVTGFGTTYFGGNRDPGPFDPEAAKNFVWESQVQHLKKFFVSLDYWKLIPADAQLTAETPRSADRTQRVGTGLRGSRLRTVICPPKSTYWALQIPGETYVIYVRGLATPVTLTLDSIGGTFVARQVDPRTGTATDLGPRNISEQVDESQIAAEGGASAARSKTPLKFTYTAPDDQDWLVVLERSR